MELDAKVFKKIKKESVVDSIIHNIMELISTEKLSPGDKLPSERVLSNYLGISRNSLREALKNIEALNIIEIRHGSGIYLKKPNIDTLSTPFLMILHGNRKVFEELVETRKIVDVQIAGLAAQRSTKENIKPIEIYLERCKEGKEKVVDESGVSRTVFESLLGEITQNRLLMSLQEVTHSIWRKKQKVFELKPWLSEEIQYDQHYMIYKAVKSKDVEAAKESMVYHIETPLRVMLRQLESDSDN